MFKNSKSSAKFAAANTVAPSHVKGQKEKLVKRKPGKVRSRTCG